MLWVFAILAGCENDQVVSKVYPNLTMTPEILDFGSVTVDYSSSSTVEMINGGLAPLNIASIEISGERADVFTVGEGPPEDKLPDDETFPLVVTFLPKDLLPYTATMTVVSDDPDSPHTVTLTGTGEAAPTPDISCDALSIDFGTVSSGGQATRWATCSNAGAGPLNISRWTQAGGGAFAIETDLAGVTIQPGAAQQVIVTYSPSTEAGDSGSFTLYSDDPDEPEVEITLLGNGGGDFPYPEAVLTCPATAVPRTMLTFDGSGSNDPNGYEPLTYHWTVRSLPDGSASAEYFTEVTDVAYLQTDIAGEYTVALQVTNSIDLLSAPAACTVNAIPEEDLHVELIWSTPGADVDLHLLNGIGSFYVKPDDCNYCNRNPEWGESGDLDNPSLDIDDLYGYGPENINVQTPAGDTYSVKVHYYETNGDGDLTATVRIYVYGVLAEEYSKVLRRDKVWDVAQIRMPDGDVIEETTALYTAPMRACE